MDTISRESNSSYLPVAGVLVGVLALIISAVALWKANAVGKRVPDGLSDRLATVESSANGAASAADQAKSGIANLQNSVQKAFDQIGPELVTLKDSVTKLEDAAKARTVAPAKGMAKAGEPVVAGPGEYVIKPGDTGVKIARENGVSLANLQTVNPGVNWNHLKIGQKIKLPAK